MTVYMCDWTRYQGAAVCPVDQIKAEGFAGVKLKCGGSSRRGGWADIDPVFEMSWEPLHESGLIPAAYWYLSPDNPRAQAGLFVDTLERCGGVGNWAVFLDVEQPGLMGTDVFNFWHTWQAITITQPMALYTRKAFWGEYIRPTLRIPGPMVFPFLEEAHWVAQSVRDSVPYASQQVHGIEPDWWDVRYGAGEWDRASMLQFTDRALVAGARTTVSVYLGTATQLRKALMA